MRADHFKKCGRMAAGPLPAALKRCLSWVSVTCPKHAEKVGLFTSRGTNEFTTAQAFPEWWGLSAAKIFPRDSVWGYFPRALRDDLTRKYVITEYHTGLSKICLTTTDSAQEHQIGCAVRAPDCDQYTMEQLSRSDEAYHLTQGPGIENIKLASAPQT